MPIPNEIATIPIERDEYWAKVQQTRCVECGLSFGFHFPDCNYQNVTFYDGIPDDELTDEQREELGV